MWYFPGPKIHSGRFGNALQVLNTGTIGSNKIILGNHQNDCFGNVSLCPDGVTISFWIYMFSHPHNWPGPVNGPVFYFFCYTPSKNPHCTVKVWNGTHRWQRNERIIYNYWHNFVWVFTPKDGLTWYVDGYRRDPMTPNPEIRGPRNLDLGCLGTQHCAIAKYDDIRVWNEAKDENFIWQFWLS